MAEVFMIGGANGSGITTSAMEFLPKYLDVFELVNADEIARGLNPIKPETTDIAYGKAMINRIQQLIKGGQNFAFETTCSSTHHVKTLQRCRAAGYKLNLIYLWIPSAAMAIQRVKSRVKQGGHPISYDIVRRHYAAGIKNMVNVYMPLVDMAVILDNSHLTSANKKNIAE